MTTDCRFFFRPLVHDIVALLRRCSAEDWLRPTLAGSWRVREVAAHLLDTALRRLSFHRDRMPPPPPLRPIRSEQELTAFVNDLNATWIHAAARLSPRVLTDLYERAGADLAEFFEGVRPDAPALFPVSWAGEAESLAWFDIGREFTEIWHHGAQIREAVGAGPFEDPQWLHAVLAIAMRALPHAYRDVAVTSGALRIVVSGPSGGTWTLRRHADRWTIEEGSAAPPTATASMSDAAAWRLLFNALTPAGARELVHLDGDPALGGPLLRARSVIV